MQIPVGPREEGLSALPLEMQAVVHCAFTWSHGGPERAAHAPQFPKKSWGGPRSAAQRGYSLLWALSALQRDSHGPAPSQQSSEP